MRIKRRGIIGAMCAYSIIADYRWKLRIVALFDEMFSLCSRWSDPMPMQYISFTA